MGADPADYVQVGHVGLPLATATEWVREHAEVERNLNGPDPYASPGKPATG